MNAVNRDSNRYQHQLAETLDNDLVLASRIGAPVLITAESRDQRETGARLIHTSRRQKQGPFVVLSINAVSPCAEAPSTSADRTHDDGVRLRQHFDHARGGTLFIDDIANLTSGAQEQLWCLLEEYSFPQLVTARSALPSVRIIAGASRDLDAERETGIFGEPLFYRLNVVHFDFTERARTREHRSLRGRGR
ncbi:MAG TPA: sigma 54-interacting transcriptional regulator [Vicinamibacterales bacterium]|nr:sigma 54-interacting transcriptional regulator [Vicinamibacterales bacterium]